MADLRTDTGRNRRVWLYALLLAILLGAVAGGVSVAVGQQVGAGVDWPDAARRRRGQAVTPGAAEQIPLPPVAGQVVPPAANPVGPPPGDALAAASPPETVVRVRIAGLHSLPQNKILPHIRTRAGRPYDPEMIQEDIRRLPHTGLFVDVRPLLASGSRRADRGLQPGRAAAADRRVVCRLPGDSEEDAAEGSRS